MHSLTGSFMTITFIFEAIQMRKVINFNGTWENYDNFRSLNNYTTETREAGLVCTPLWVLPPPHTVPHTNPTAGHDSLSLTIDCNLDLCDFISTKLCKKFWLPFYVVLGTFMFAVMWWCHLSEERQPTGEEDKAFPHLEACRLTSRRRLHSTVPAIALTAVVF